MTAKKLKEIAEAYVDELRYECSVVEKRPILHDNGSGKMVPYLDDYGHVIYEYYTPQLPDGREATVIKWLRMPGVAGLCARLGINRSTLWRWCRISEDEPDRAKRKLGEAARMARTMIESMLEECSGQKGALESLRANFWANQEDEAETQQETMTIDEMVEELEVLGFRCQEEEEKTQ